MAGLEAERAKLMLMMQESSDTEVPTPASLPVSLHDSSANRQPRKIGGFIDDGDDDDEADTDLSRPRGTPMKGPVIADPESSDPVNPKSPSSDVHNHDVARSHSEQSRNDANAAVLEGNSSGIPSPTALRSDSGAADDTYEPTEFSQSQQVLASNHAESASFDIQSANVVDQSAVVAEPVTVPRARLPHDRVGILEDRIKADPKGDVDAWLGLIDEHRKRNKISDARNTYERFFDIFPTAAEQWVAYTNMELNDNDIARTTRVFEKALHKTSTYTWPNVQLWSAYLNYVRRMNNITTDPTGTARQNVHATYDHVLGEVGIDKDSGQIWQDYLHFLHSGPGQLGGTGWQDQQKMDTLRKAYRRAICIPTQAVNGLWKEYENFELGLNKVTGRRFLQEKSSEYITARSGNTALQNMTRELNRTTVPTLPPAKGFEGHADYMRQVDLWQSWITWEKGDPLALKHDELAVYRDRILYVYKQATMTLRFWPQIWYEAVQFCFGNGLETEAKDFLIQGTAANPESCLLAFQHADWIESLPRNAEGMDTPESRGKAVREPYNKVLDTLYELVAKIKDRRESAIARITESFAQHDNSQSNKLDDGDNDEYKEARTDLENTKKSQIQAVSNGFALETNLLRRTITFVWIALMRAMRRVQGQGKPKGGAAQPIGGCRQIMADARVRGQTTSDFVVACAYLEFHCYRDNDMARKIFDNGSKRFKDDERLALEYLKFLATINDLTNARVVFEKTVQALQKDPETVAKSKALYAYFHSFEARYGELAQVKKLEDRMRELFPEDPQLLRFSARYAAQAFDAFDATATRPIISPSQTRAPLIQVASAERTASVRNSPRPGSMFVFPSNNSPKRPFEGTDNESANPARKMMRAESPLKGAAGRRMDAQKRTVLRNEVQALGYQRPPSTLPLPHPPPPALPPNILHLLSVLPRPDAYGNTPVFIPEKFISLLAGVDFSKAHPTNYTAVPPALPPQHDHGQSKPPYGYGK